jgi:transposase
MTSFRPYEPDQQLLLPPSLRDWLPADHLVWFISETVDQLDLSEILDGYRDGGQGNLAYHPAMMLKILIYAYATGVFSSRRIARQIEENIAFGVLAAGNMPDHRTICRFREQHVATDPESRIMKDGSGAFQQCYNAQTAVDGQQRIIVSASVQQSASDAPALGARLPAVQLAGALESQR